MTRVFVSTKSVRCAVLALLAAVVSTDRPIHAHHPDKENAPVWQYLDVIPPLGNRLPPGYRRKYNRPPYLQGRLMYHIAPSSQEAMAWHRAAHADAYRKPKKCYRLEQHFFYPKPWEVLQTGPRKGDAQADSSYANAVMPGGDMPELLPTESAYRSDVEDAAPVLETVLPDLEPEPQLDLPKLELEDLRGEATSPSDLLPSLQSSQLLEPVGFTDWESHPGARKLGGEKPAMATISVEQSPAQTTRLGTQLRRSLLANQLITEDRERSQASRVSRSTVSPNSPFLKRTPRDQEPPRAN